MNDSQSDAAGQTPPPPSPPSRQVWNRPEWVALAQARGFNAITEHGLFEVCRAEFVRDFDGVPATDPYLYGTIGGADDVRDLRNPTKQNFSEEKRRKLVCFMLAQDPRRDSLYASLSKMIDQDAADTARVLEKYAGKYNYFRYIPEPKGPAVYRMGAIEICEDKKVPIFKMWSGNTPGDLFDENPENTGEVYCGGNQLYFVGRRSNVMRLAICREFVRSKADGFGKGIVLTTTKESLEPFSAQFILVDTANDDLIRRFDNPTIDVARQKAMGQVEFDALWGDGTDVMTLDSPRFPRGRAKRDSYDPLYAGLPLSWPISHSSLPET